MTAQTTRTTAGAAAPADSFRAQNGEDRWLDRHFAGKRGGFFVDVGAYDGVNLSNSFHFEQLGWTGVLVEPDPDNAARCRDSRPGSRTFQCAVVDSPDITEITFHQVTDAGVFSTTNLSDDHARRLANMGRSARSFQVAARTLDSILSEVDAPPIDFVSIDVEGAEMDVLNGFDIQRWKPEIVVVESNSKKRLPAIRDYFLAHGYAYRHSIDVNDFYQRIPAGPAVARVIDALRYARHRINRRAARLAHNLRRAWNKHKRNKAR
jgi:FkbM family methyltransferase